MTRDEAKELFTKKFSVQHEEIIVKTTCWNYEVRDKENDPEDTGRGTHEFWWVHAGGEKSEQFRIRVMEKETGEIVFERVGRSEKQQEEAEAEIAFLEWSKNWLDECMTGELKNLVAPSSS